MDAVAIVAIVAFLVGVSALVLGLLWLVNRRGLNKSPVTAPPPRPAVSREPFTAADAQAIYRHFLATIGWALFWFSGMGGAAGILLFQSTDNRLDYPLVIVAVVSWGSLGAALTMATRTELRKLHR